MPNSGPLAIVQLDEVVATVLLFLRKDAPTRVALDLAGPDRLSFIEVVLAYRRWLGWAPPALIAVPGWAASVMFRIGDAVGWLGWRPPIRSTARREIARGAVGDNSEWRRLTGIDPETLAAALAREPASVQERWFARLYLLKPIAFGAFSSFWIITGLISLGPGWDPGKRLMYEGGVTEPLASAAVIAGALADIAVGAAIALRRTTRVGLLASLAISVVYIVLGTWPLPDLWRDPLGPLLKVWPILALNLLLLAIYRDR
jgi:hypothetical protein